MEIWEFAFFQTLYTMAKLFFEKMFTNFKKNSIGDPVLRAWISARGRQLMGEGEEGGVSPRRLHAATSVPAQRVHGGSRDRKSVV